MGMKRILAAIASGLICSSASGCTDVTSYQQAATIKTMSDVNAGYFTEITKWIARDCSRESLTYHIVFANDTKVKYLLIRGQYGVAITPLYNADGSLQIYE